MTKEQAQRIIELLEQINRNTQKVAVVPHDSLTSYSSQNYLCGGSGGTATDGYAIK